MILRRRTTLVAGLGVLALSGSCRADVGQGPISEYSPDAEPKLDEGYSKPPVDDAGSEGIISAKSVAFKPNPNTVIVGTKVSFVNRDSFAHHLVSGKRGAPDRRFDKELVGIGISTPSTGSAPTSTTAASTRRWTAR